jgi:ribosome-binding protein aMBF1 (putative translation factor)
VTEPIDLSERRKRPARAPKSSQAYRSDTIYPDRVASARILMQLSIEQVAELSGIGVADLEMFETGMLTPTYEQLQVLAEVTGFPVAWFGQPPVKGWDIDQTSLRFH